MSLSVFIVFVYLKTIEKSLRIKKVCLNNKLLQFWISPSLETPNLAFPNLTLANPITPNLA
jgi:hypothetical protein